MENEKQNDVVEDLIVNNEPTTESASVPETLVIETAPVVEEQLEEVLEPVSVENNVDAPVVDNNNIEGEVATNNEVILEPVPSQAQVNDSMSPALAVDTPVDVNVVEVAPVPAVEEPVLVENPNLTDVSAANIDVPNINSGIATDTPEQMPAPVVNPVDGGSTVDALEKPKKKKTGLIIGIIVVLVAVIAVVGVFVAKSMMSNPYKIFTTLVDEGYTEVANILKEADKKSIKYNFDDTLVLNGNIKLNSSMTELESYLAYDYDYKIGLDPKGEKVEAGLSMNKDGQAQLDVFLYIIKNMIYIKSDKAYDKVLYSQSDENVFVDVNFDEYKTNYTIDDVNKLIELYLGYVKKAVKEDKFTTEEGTVKYEGKDLEVNKIKYELTKDEQYEFANSIYESMKADNEFKGLVKKITGLTDEDYADFLDDMKPESSDYENADTATFYIYTTGFFPSVVGIGMTSGKTVMDFVGDDEKAEFAFTENGVVVNANIKDNVIDGKFQDGKSSTTFKITTKETDKTTNADVELGLTQEGKTINLNFSINNEKVNDKKVTNKLTVNLKVPMDGDTLSVGAVLTNNLEIGAKVVDVDTTGAVLLETLTDADLQVIYNNVKAASTGSPLELLFLLLEANTEPVEPFVDYNIVG